MRILVDLTHPAFVHFYRHAIQQWLNEGEDVLITSRHKDVTTDLLDEFGFEHQCLSTVGRGLVGLTQELVSRSREIDRLAQAFRPDVLTACAGPFIIYSGLTRRIPTVVFYDTDHDYLSNILVYPTATVVATPRSYEGFSARNHLRYAGNHALAYTHPNVFTPDTAVLATEGIEPDEPFTIVRMVNWMASHDIGDSGVSDLRLVVDTLKQYGRVIISSEADLSPDLASLQMKGARRNMLHLQAFARLYFGESATMACECGTLGTPAIFVSTSRRGYINELQNHFDMVYSYNDPLNGQRDALAKAVDLLENPETPIRWRDKREKLLAELIDVTQFIMDTVRRYATKHD